MFSEDDTDKLFKGISNHLKIVERKLCILI